MTKAKKIRNSCLLMLTAFIWGVAFVAQSEGGKAAGPFSFNGIRNIIASAFLLVVIFVNDRIKKCRYKKHCTSEVSSDGSKDMPSCSFDRKDLIIGGVSCGIILFLGSTMQQLGIACGAAVGKAGFLTACYIMIVPVLGLFLHKKCGLNVWLAVLFAVVGLYLLCIKEGFSIEKCDLILLAGAVFFSCHILVIDYFSPKVDGVKMSCIQFLVCGLLNVVPILLWDMKIFSCGISDWVISLSSLDAWIPILFAGILSSGVGYTLQIVGQNGLDPTIASLIMSLESVFSVLAGWLLLNQKLTIREISGCILIFAGIILAQIPMKRLKLYNKNK